jgi:hypothetical protein
MIAPAGAGCKRLIRVGRLRNARHRRFN